MSGASQSAGPRESAQNVAYRWLKQQVATMPRHEGVFLTEGAAAEATGISRTPVREALLRLQAEGFLQIVPKKGAYVPPISDAEVEAVMQARALVEDWCIRRIAPIAEIVTEELRRLIEQQEQLLGDPIGFIECDRAFHRVIVGSAGNPVLADFYETLRDRQVRMGLQAVTSSPDRARGVLTEHGAIVDALLTGEPEAAGQALAAHLVSTASALRLPSPLPWGEGRSAR
ncbi:GntR family transcriptional regulator [Geodermatophilus sp. URMC 64]